VGPTTYCYWLWEQEAPAKPSELRQIQVNWGALPKGKWKKLGGQGQVWRFSLLFCNKFSSQLKFGTGERGCGVAAVRRLGPKIVKLRNKEPTLSTTGWKWPIGGCKCFAWSQVGFKVVGQKPARAVCPRSNIAICHMLPSKCNNSACIEIKSSPTQVAKVGGRTAFAECSAWVRVSRASAWCARLARRCGGCRPEPVYRPVWKLAPATTRRTKLHICFSNEAS